MWNVLSVLNILALFVCVSGCESPQAPTASVAEAASDPLNTPLAPVAPNPIPTTEAPSPVPAIDLTYYTLTETRAPVSGWPTKTFTSTGACVVYNSSTYCWDDGVKTLEWTSISTGSYVYGPYYNTFWEIGSMSNPPPAAPCDGGCGYDFMATPKIYAGGLAYNLASSSVEQVLTTGIPHSVSCSLANQILDCGDFSIDLTQVPQ